MNIVHLAKYYPPEWGGMERVTHDLVTGMASHSVKSHVIAFTRKPELGGTEKDAVATITRCPLLANPGNQPLSLGWLGQSLRAGIGADGVIVHAPNLLAFPVMLLLALMRLFRGGPRHVVLLWHSDIVDKGALGLAMRPFELAMALCATRIVATSPPYAEASSVLRRFSGRTQIIPLGIEPPAPRPPVPAQDADLHGWIAGRPLILAVGRLVPYKGFDVLVAAMAEIAASGTHFCCLIVGTGPEAERLNAAIAEHNLSSSVRIVGPVNEKLLEALFHTAMIYCMSSRVRAEAFGVVLLEAMSHGLPIVAAQIPGSGVPWVAGGPDVAVLVPPENAPSLASALRKLLADPALAARMGADAKVRFANQFTREAMVQKFLQLLKS